MQIILNDSYANLISFMNLFSKRYDKITRAMTTFLITKVRQNCLTKKPTLPVHFNGNIKGKMFVTVKNIFTCKNIKNIKKHEIKKNCNTYYLHSNG